MPPPPPQTPDREESGPPLSDRPGQKAGDFVERDLWNLDAEEDAASKPPAREKITPRKQALAREQPPGNAAADTARPARPAKPAKPEYSGTDDGPKPDPVTPRRPVDMLPSLDEEHEASPADSGEPADGAAEARNEPAGAAPPAEEPQADSASVMAVEPMPLEAEKPAAGSEFDEQPPAGEPAGADRRPLRLSTTELVSLGVLLLAILIAGGWALKTFFAEIPTREARVPVPSFPARGERGSVKSAETFWREPTEADNARSSARLIPVLDLELEPRDGRGALRIFFRDAEASTVGDPRTKSFSGGIFTDTKAARIEIVASDGFDDEGKHAAYQTSQTDPWTVEVFEGPQANAPFEKFTLLFKMPISTDRR